MNIKDIYIFVTMDGGNKVDFRLYVVSNLIWVLFRSKIDHNYANLGTHVRC